ncbi:hypothetical protein BDU57DRAFT_512541 [Ampelomyces quisqualis]|uniref:Uncharacterized protein n=1 Tax=Ampelomyces quisqualis TaxID=50730 RepID=A0A6A5QXS2_AMPQU|nr:hypothetical protein BDU57DRAFT_512541 [Ampelomyces quisqualis]
MGPSVLYKEGHCPCPLYTVGFTITSFVSQVHTSKMTRIRMTRIAIFLALPAISLALEVSPNSPCAAKCIDDARTGDVANRSSSLTFSTDLFCHDWEVVGSNSTQNGQKLKDCNNCLKSSGYGSDEWPETDRGWFMFNNRAIVDWCLFGRFAEESNPNKTETSIYKTCNSSCNRLYNAADYQVKSNPDSYNFCDNSGNFTSDADSCLQCLYDTPGLTILGNGGYRMGFYGSNANVLKS